MAKFTITVHRTGTQTGRLQYNGTTAFNCKCWWNPDARIPTSPHDGYEALVTRMAESRRKAVWLRDVPGYQGIFIHHWPGESASLTLWSQGCILVLQNYTERIYNEIGSQGPDDDPGRVFVHDVAPAIYLPRRPARTMVA